MYSKLKLLFNVPLASALAFLIVGAPSAYLTEFLPSSGDAHGSNRMNAPGLTGWEAMLIAGGVAVVATFLFFVGHRLFFRTKAGRAYRRRLGKLIAGPEWGK